MGTTSRYIETETVLTYKRCSYGIHVWKSLYFPFMVTVMHFFFMVKPYRCRNAFYDATLQGGEIETQNEKAPFKPHATRPNFLGVLAAFLLFYNLL